MQGNITDYPKPIIIKLTASLRLKKWFEVNREWKTLKFVLPFNIISNPIFFKPTATSPYIKIKNGLEYTTPVPLNKFYLKLSGTIIDDGYLYIYLNNEYKTNQNEIFLPETYLYASGHFYGTVTPNNNLVFWVDLNMYKKNTVIQFNNFACGGHSLAGTSQPVRFRLSLGSAKIEFYVMTESNVSYPNEFSLKAPYDNSWLVFWVQNEALAPSNLISGFASCTYKIIYKPNKEIDAY